MVKIVLIRSPIFHSSNPFSKLMGTIPSTPITIGIAITFMLHSFLISLAGSEYLSCFLLSLIFSLWSAGVAKSTIWQVLVKFHLFTQFFPVAVVLILLYGCTRTLTKRLKKKLDSNYTRMLRAILNKSWRQHSTRHQLYGHLPPIAKTIQVRWTRHAGHCWRSKDKLISDVLLWTPAYGQAKAGWPARTYIQQLCEDMGCRPEDLPEAMNDREKWRERVRDICASSMTWWWWHNSQWTTSPHPLMSSPTRPLFSFASFTCD